jgi:hypothetical protein
VGTLPPPNNDDNQFRLHAHDIIIDRIPCTRHTYIRTCIPTTYFRKYNPTYSSSILQFLIQSSNNENAITPSFSQSANTSTSNRRSGNHLSYSSTTSINHNVVVFPTPAARLLRKNYIQTCAVLTGLYASYIRMHVYVRTQTNEDSEDRGRRPKALHPASPAFFAYQIQIG